MIRTKCQFVDMALALSAALLVRWHTKMLEMQFHHIPSHSYGGHGLNGSIFSASDQVYLAFFLSFYFVVIFIVNSNSFSQLFFFGVLHFSVTLPHFPITLQHCSLCDCAFSSSLLFYLHLSHTHTHSLSLFFPLIFSSIATSLYRPPYTPFSLSPLPLSFQFYLVSP